MGVKKENAYHTAHNLYNFMQSPTGKHEEKRAWCGGNVKYKPPDQFIPRKMNLNHEHMTTKSNNEPSNGTTTEMIPPWLQIEDANENNDEPVAGPSIDLFLKSVARKKEVSSRSSVKVGANFDRREKYSDNWLPSFGGVWNEGARWKTRVSYPKRNGAHCDHKE